MEPRRLNVPRIALRLAELNLTVESFTADAGLDRRTVQRLLSGKTQNPQYSTVKAMADFLALQPRDILLIAGADTATDASTPRAMPDVEMHLPVTGAYLVGRAQEMERLDHAWSGGQANILSIVGWGGLGKSTLVNHWVGRLAQDGWRGADRVFGWTFSRQGMQDPVASADSFIEASLRYCGDPEPSLGTPWDKGQRLARFVGAKRTLLILDGLEPLQYPPGPEAGKVKDPALATFLQNLALHNAGLCIITTRIAVADIAALQFTMQTCSLLTLCQRQPGPSSYAS
jgi:hypothetical protein